MARVLIIIAVFAAVVACLPFLMQQASQPQVFMVNTLETTLSWPNGPDVELNAVSIARLNLEVDQLAERELPGAGLHYPVKSLGKRRVEVMYIGSKSVPPGIQKRLNAYIQNRLPELARQQAGG
jgi:hypothetical protein